MTCVVGVLKGVNKVLIVGKYMSCTLAAASAVGAKQVGG